jgi:hypothetical protein
VQTPVLAPVLRHGTRQNRQGGPHRRLTANSTVAKKLLARARGATIAEIQTATGWQPHSARAFLSGLRKAGQTLVKEERKSGETSYRLVAVASVAVAGSEAAE